jgi:hypothetical protein
MKIDPAEYRRIEDLIQSDDSPVGIDAKKTHVYIIHMLETIERRLVDFDNRLRQIEVRERVES